MNTLDRIILVMFLIGIVKGWAGGFFRQVVSGTGFLAGLLVAYMLYAVLGDWLAPQLGAELSMGRALAFILLWIGVPVLLSLVAYILTQTMKGMNLGGLNRLGGACIGGLKYVIFISCVLNVAFRLQLISTSLEESSRLYSPVQQLSEILFELGKEQVCRMADTVE